MPKGEENRGKPSTSRPTSKTYKGKVTISSKPREDSSRDQPGARNETPWETISLPSHVKANGPLFSDQAKLGGGGGTETILPLRDSRKLRKKVNGRSRELPGDLANIQRQPIDGGRLGN